MSNRPNYVLKLADGTERVFVPHPKHDDLWRYDGRSYYQSELKNIGATPVPQEEPKVEYAMVFGHDSPCSIRHHSVIPFRSHEDAENYRLRCESIGPEWNDGKKYSDPLGDGFTFGFQLVFGFPTNERRQEWLDRFGKAWGLK